MELTHERWAIERKSLQEAIATAERRDPQGLLAEAFRRALAWLERHPAGKKPNDAQMQA
ncbi:hypothetical protein [Paracoccus benzoatiresistens]|uniref:Uncharacterized protein n=1 Tax=Paracoccus benzoatiresistens TaxID=2997341 RepID=A0ABT4JAB8_9RHOB|nr:hypothetical protein [Paracoccus sp. EF6]MCZ0963864.1 hypothetical protein [Paracoccus sp. EF6]